MLRTCLCVWLAGCCTTPLLGQAPGRPHRLGVIVPVPATDLPAPAMGLLAELECLPEILVLGEGETQGKAFGFSGLRANLEAYAAHGLGVALTVTPHIRTVPYAPLSGPAGAQLQDRQNPFDPAFLSEWERLHHEFREQFGRDPRVRRVYVAPPSYFGEIEYYMGRDWSAPRFLSYDVHARARFAEFLEAKYGTVSGLNRAWGTVFASFDKITAPLPLSEPAVHDSAAWLDLMQWRVEYLSRTVAREMHTLGQNAGYRLGLKVSWGDCAARNATHTAGILSRSRDLEKIDLHTTNPHSLSDLRYAANLARRYGAGRLIVENDGNRYGRTEVAKILFAFLLNGADEFNFAYHAHLLHAPPSWQPSETWRVLYGTRALFDRYTLTAVPSGAAFLQSESTRFVRAPGYLCRDVAVVYDTVFVNAVGPAEGVFAWGRSLGFPDVTGEQAVLDGDLEGRRFLVLPATAVTLLPATVTRRLEAWIEAGGTMVVFGGRESVSVRRERPTDSRACEPWPLLAGLPEPGTATEGWSVADTPRQGPEQAPASWRATDLAEAWTPWARDADGGAVAARRPVGRGALLVFPWYVPVRTMEAPAQARFLQDVVPAMLQDLALESGVAPSVRVHDSRTGKPSHALAVGYAGQDRDSGTHVFVAGGYDQTTPVLRLELGSAGTLQGEAELILVDLDRVAVRGGASGVESLAASQAEVYRDPTNTERFKGRSIPCTVIRFTAPAVLDLALRPVLDP